MCWNIGHQGNGRSVHSVGLLLSFFLKVIPHKQNRHGELPTTASLFHPVSAFIGLHKARNGGHHETLLPIPARALCPTRRTCCCMSNRIGIHVPMGTTITTFGNDDRLCIHRQSFRLKQLLSVRFHDQQWHMGSQGIRPSRSPNVHK